MQSFLNKYKLIRFLFDTHILIFTSIFLGLSLLINFSMNLIPSADSSVNDALDHIHELYGRFLYIVILAPLVETILFQAIPVELIGKCIKNEKLNFFLSVFLSAFIFSSVHMYSIYYIVYTFFAGFILALAYFLCKYRNEGSFWVVQFNRVYY